MPLASRTFFVAAAALLAGTRLFAQASPPPAPLPGSAADAGYRSAFEGYRPFAAGEVQDWRGANDTVRAIGGWRAYAREIHGDAPAAAPPAAATPGAAPAAPQAPAPAARPQRAPTHQGHHR